MSKTVSTQSDILQYIFQSLTSDTILKQSGAMDTLLGYYASFGQNYPAAVVICSPDGRIQSRNENRDDFLMNMTSLADFNQLLLPTSFQDLEAGFQHTIEQSKVTEIHIKTNQQAYDVLVIPLTHNGKVEGASLIFKETTAKHKLSISNSFPIFDHLKIGIWVSEFETGKIIYASKTLAELYEHPHEQFYIENIDIRQVIQKFIHPEDRYLARKQVINILTGEKSINFRYRIQCMDGEIKWLTCHTAPYFDQNGDITHIVGIQTDITEDVKLQEDLEHAAHHDILTTLPNRKSLEEKLAQYLLEKQPFGLLFLNLDRFSMINKALGYDVGDEVLKTIASRLLLLLPEGSFIARLESNDFIILLKQSKEEIAAVTDQLIEDIKQPFVIDEYDIEMTTSVGVSMYPKDGETAESLMGKAHSALKYAKKSGKNTYRFYSYSKDIAFQRKIAIEKDMVEALEKDKFELFYQPLVDTKSLEIIGAEALLRWRHHEWGLISPAEFIPIAEENLFINDISDWVIQKACQQMKSWKKKGYTLIPISINISPIRLMKRDFVSFMKRQLEKYDIPKKYIGIEITEGSLLKSEKGVLDTLAELKQLGVRVAIDDFGTGFASLNYLRQYEADTLKIDQVFIQSRDGLVERDKIIVGSVMEMAKALNMKTVAEGVEEYRQYHFLKNHDCDIVQGNLFSEPVSVEDFEKLLTKRILRPL